MVAARCNLSGWSWINYWPNFLQGMSHDLHAWRPQDHTDRTDGIDGWGSPIVEFAHRSLHRYLIQDHGLLEANPGEPRLLAGCHRFAVARALTMDDISRAGLAFSPNHAQSPRQNLWLSDE